MSIRYKSSEEMLERALKVIPLGTQTFSKSKTQFPFGVSPYFLSRGQGSHVWDVDKNEYIDFVNSQTAMTLGYNDPDVNAAVKKQLEDGVILSLPHKLEVEVAEEIVKMVPCAEMARFGKNGSDATAGAIRVARAYTKRDHVVVCGYHGWQDWYIGSTVRNKGVPEATIALTHAFMYNDIASLHKLLQQYPQDIAAVIMEPMNVSQPQENFLQEVKELTHAYGAILIFDETITGFRYVNGGAQEYFNVIPDLACFGKGVANGYPLSVLAGRADIMKLLEEVFFSFTFGGEILSLAASMATMKKLQREPVLKVIKQQGQKVLDGVNKLIKQHELDYMMSTAGHPSWTFLQIKDAGIYSMWQIKTLLMQEMFLRGILIYGTHNISYAHSDEDIQALLQAYSEILPLLKAAVENRTLEQYLNCKPLEPLFKIR